jgi:hypothetical protein
MTTQIERTLQTEVMLRLRAGAWPVIALPIPNGIWFPTRDEKERELVRRLIARMKADGMLVPGAPDLALVWGEGRGGIIELKRPASRDLLGKHPAGRPSDAQRDIAERAADLGANHAYCSSWDDVRATLHAWGAA